MTLKDFIQNKMRMSHIYQPVMIKTLLLCKGTATRKEVARKILEYDMSQVEYYEKVVDNMVGRVLRSHNIIFKNKDLYELNNYKDLMDAEKEELIQLCNQKIDEYIKKRGEAIFHHRKRNRKPVSGLIRYQVLKRAHGRCELCGISKDEKALEVDHIVPKNLGGEDSINNYQALCFTCNANKRDSDATDFRKIHTFYEHKDSTCVFCNLDKSRIIFKNNLALLIEDAYPVTENHGLVIPKRHVSDYFDLTQAEINAVHELLNMYREKLTDRNGTKLGFNIGVNSGKVAGQTVFHCHVHIIPRKDGDVKDPTGGVRNVIPGRGRYHVN